MKQTGLYRLLMTGAILVVLLNTWMADRALRTMFSAQTWLSHTLETIRENSAVTEQLFTANSAFRAYLLTGDAVHLEHYRTALTTMQQDIDQVQSLTSDNVSQQARIKFLRSRLQIKIDAMNTVAAMRSTHGSEALPPEMLRPALAESPDGQVSARYMLRQIENEERRLLDDRKNETMVSRRQVWAAGGIASVLDILLVIAAFELMVRAHRDRRKLADRADEIATLNQELTGLNADLEHRVDQRTRELAASNEELEAFSYSVSHDLRAPLRTIDGFSLALQEDFADKLNDEGRDYIQRVRSGVQRMGQLIDSLLQLSRVTRTDLQRENIDMSQLSKLVFEELARADSEVKTTFSTTPGMTAFADQRLVRIALENLIGNAWKFTARTAEGRIEFGRLKRGDADIYFVRDNGAGFDMQYVDRLFTAFQRLHGDRDFKGSGIGLATVARIIRRHHGEIWAESVQEHGATFFFMLGS